MSVCRDCVARAEDDSYGYVMSVYVMIRVARKCPSSRDQLEGCGNPLPPLVQQHAEEILAIVEVRVWCVFFVFDLFFPVSVFADVGVLARTSVQLYAS